MWLPQGSQPVPLLRSSYPSYYYNAGYSYPYYSYRSYPYYYGANYPYYYGPAYNYCDD